MALNRFDLSKLKLGHEYFVPHALVAGRWIPVFEKKHIDSYDESNKEHYHVDSRFTDSLTHLALFYTPEIVFKKATCVRLKCSTENHFEKESK